MRHAWSRAIGLLGAFAGVACAASVAGAAPAATDLSISLGFGGLGSLETDKTTTTARTFRVSVIVQASSFVPEPIRVRVQLGDGLRWGSDAPDAAHGCAGTAPAVCTGTTDAGSGGNFKFWSWYVDADHTGQFEITADLEDTGPDPDTSNNTTVFRFQVVPEGGGGSGGSGGSGGGSGRASASASAAKVNPAKPKAGSLVTATVRVTSDGSPVRPSDVACAASAGGAKVKGTGRAGSGSVTCSYRPPRSAKGKVLSGSVAFTAGDKRFTKRFSARLG